MLCWEPCLSTLHIAALCGHPLVISDKPPTQTHRTLPYFLCPRPEAFEFGNDHTEMIHIMAYEKNVKPEMPVHLGGKGDRMKATHLQTHWRKPYGGKSKSGFKKHLPIDQEISFQSSVDKVPGWQQQKKCFLGHLFQLSAVISVLDNVTLNRKAVGPKKCQENGIEWARQAPASPANECSRCGISDNIASASLAI